MSKAAWLVAALVVVGGCKDKDESEDRVRDRTKASRSETLPAPTTEQIDGLIRGLDAVARAAPEMRIAFVAQLMHETVAADDPCFADADTDLTDDKAFDLDRTVACARPCAIELAKLTRLAPDTRMAALRTECKDRLDVPPAAHDLLTPQLLLAARAGRLLSHAHSVAPPDRADALLQGMRSVEIRLPVPAWTQSYRLPTAPAAVARAHIPQRYAIISESDTTTYHQAPLVRFAKPGIEVAQASAEAPAKRAPGAIGIPGSPNLHDTGADIERQKGQYAIRNNAATDPQLSRKQAIEQARETGILGLLKQQQQSVPATMILADAQIPAQTIVRTARDMGGAILGVTGGGPTAWALLTPRDPLPVEGGQSARVTWTEAPATFVIALTDSDVSVRIGSDRRQIPRAGSAVDIEAIREVVRAWRGQPELQDATDVAIEVSGKASYRDLVDVISALAQDAPFVFDLRVTDK